MSSHTIVELDNARKRYTIRHKKTAKVVPGRLEDDYVLYSELYRTASITNKYMDEHCKRLLGRSEWRALGSAVFAVLPHLDEYIKSQKGRLCISGLGQGKGSDAMLLTLPRFEELAVLCSEFL